MNPFKTMVDMSWTDLEKARGENAIVLFPLGVIEEHGPHLCLGTDIYTAEIYCANVQAKLKESGVNSIVAPPFYWGICQSTRGFIGSFSIRMETAVELIYDILHSLKSFGFHEVYGINAHGDIEQNVLLLNSFQKASENLDMKARYLFRKEVMHFYGLTGQEDHVCPVEPQTWNASGSNEPDVHAGDIETAIIHRYWPGCVDIGKASQLPPVTLPEGRDMEWLLGGNTKALSADGYVGNPAKFTMVPVEKHVEDRTERYVDAILGKRRAERPSGRI